MAIKALGDIVNVISEHISNPSTSGYNIFVGLEHYDSGEPVITRFGSTEQLESSVKHFKKGDILVARRNVYLKRAGVVNFEGVTSGDSIVLRVKEEQYKEIIPFILNTEDFWDYAEQNSDGTMSKRLAPDVLLEYECNIPDNHQKIAEKLWAAYKLKEAYKKMISTTDEMVKSQFIEMFGDPNKGNWTASVADYCYILGGFAFKSDLFSSTGVPIVRISNINDGVVDIDQSINYGYDFWVSNPSYRVLDGDILMAMSGATTGKVGVFRQNVPALLNQRVACIRQKEGKSVSSFLYAALQSDFMYKTIQSSAQGGAQPNISSKQISKLPMPAANILDQKKFESIAQQADKSKFELRKSIESIDAVIKSLINS